jgi:hypothetical protein
VWVGIVDQGSAMPHKFTIGQTVHFRPAHDRSVAGLYVVTKQLPEKDGEFQYRIKHPAERHERIARESELRWA